MALDLTTYDGDPAAILALPGAVLPADAPAEGTLAKRADRMWEIAEAVLGRPVPGAKPFP
ncbi:hypothetical protein [Azospirillum sp.]|uniref:hypothetical protein n=1 Tax=Azospirillum sp. TaxID=34012 RepID=UPI003D712434